MFVHILPETTSITVVVYVPLEKLRQIIKVAVSAPFRGDVLPAGGFERLEVAAKAANQCALQRSSVPNGDLNVNNWLHAKRFDPVKLSLVRAFVRNYQMHGCESVRFKVFKCASLVHH